MFLSKLFRKDHRHYMAQGEKHLAAERYADARCSFLEARERAGADAAADLLVIGERLAFTGNRLGELNLLEGERSLTCGDDEKAMEHFDLARQLAEDGELKSQAERALASVRRVRDIQSRQAPRQQESHHHHAGGCSSCHGSSSGATDEVEDAAAGLSDEDRFQLLVHPLPEGLAPRYSALGGEFAQAYLHIHDGEDAKALPILEKMLVSCENDIVIYEVALIMFRSGRTPECEAMLERALALNPGNQLIYLAKVQLATGAGRFDEAVATLERMMELNLLADQAKLMLAEVHAEAGNGQAAFEHWTEALSIPSIARPAAEKLVPLLTGMGRKEEAQYLTKRYLKGCC